MIVKRGDKWCLLTKDGSKTLGCHDTKEGAERQERAVQVSKNAAAPDISNYPITERDGKFCHSMPDGDEMCHDSRAEAERHVQQMVEQMRAASSHLIVFRGGHWCVLSRDGGWVLSRHATLESARAWVRARGLGGARHLHVLQAAVGELRTATFEGREHVVVPVVALVEGVLFPANAEEPELVLAEEFSKAPQGWNGRPVMFDHPAAGAERVSANDPRTLEQHSYGRVFNARVAGKKLVMEAWVDPQRAQAVGATRSLERIRAGETVEISVGVFVVPEERPGVWNGQRYATIWREITPDHLAFLPEGLVGACSVEAGCGAPRAATVHAITLGEAVSCAAARVSAGRGGWRLMRTSDGCVWDESSQSWREEKDMAKDGRTWRDRIAGFFRAAGAGLSDADVRALLDAALRAEEPGFLGVDSVFPEETLVVYAVAPSATDPPRLVRRGYEVDAVGHVKLSADKEQVEPVTRFEPVVTAEHRAEQARRAAFWEPRARALAARYPDGYPRELVEKLCAPCGEKLRTLGVTRVKLFRTAQCEGVAGMPEATLAGLCSKWPGSGGFSHTDCSESMGGKVEDAAAFCACLEHECTGTWPAENVETEGRSARGKEGGDVDKKKELVGKILARKDKRFAEADAPVLEQLPEERLQALAEEPEPKPEEEPKKPEPETEEQVLARFPNVKAAVESEKRRVAARREELMAGIKATKQDAYSEDELKAMGVEQLEKVSKLAAAKVATDQSGRGLPRQEGDDRTPPPPINLAERIRAARAKSA